MKVRIYTDYYPVVVLRGVSGKNFTEPTDLIASKANLSGNFVEIDDSKIPSDRLDRKYWKVDKDKIVVDQVKKQNDLDKQAQSEIKKNAILQKMGITKKEYEDLNSKEEI